MNPDQLRALADALSRQRQADEHGIYCAVPRQAVDAAIKYLRAQADAQPVAWMYEHDGCVDTPLFTVNRWTKCEEPWNESPLFLHPAPAAPQAEPCIGNDPTCPCQDGDACHYRDAADGTKGWPVPQAEPKPTPASDDDLGVYKGMADSYRNDAQAEPKRDQSMLDLLAVIHCDGGHHTEAVGIEQSIKNAQDAVCALKVRLALAETKREPLSLQRIHEIERWADQQWRANGQLVEWSIVFVRAVERAHEIGGSDE